MKQDMTPLKKLYLIYNTNPSLNWRENIKLDMVKLIIFCYDISIQFFIYQVIIEMKIEKFISVFNILSKVFKYLSHDRATTVHRKNESLKVLTTAKLQKFLTKTKKARGAKLLKLCILKIQRNTQFYFI